MRYSLLLLGISVTLTLFGLVQSTDCGPFGHINYWREPGCVANNFTSFLEILCRAFKCRYHIEKQIMHYCIDPKCNVHSFADSIYGSCSPSFLRIYSTSVCWTYKIIHKMPLSSSSVWLDQKIRWVYWHPALRENKGLRSYSLCMEAGRLQTAPGHSLQVILHSWNYGEHTFWLNDTDCFSVCKTATNCSDVTWLCWRHYNVWQQSTTVSIAS